MKERNLSKCLFILVAVLALASIIVALITRNVSVASYVLVEMEVIIFSLVLALIDRRDGQDEKR